jgi:hypothetical protein
MPIKYIPYTPNTIEDQTILDNITHYQHYWVSVEKSIEVTTT